ncbi:sodium:proton antiporter NhaD [Halosquirtibacter xylanolyticus]|uniref:sodium:proton antiporter NhaD n=1 Tax=Halosquirtibacter xylanolyticus TaxID=3374599 RepID=UPI00374782E8|nr:sodium:proton antiporter NhaD [Prolixibacteraceae bacterium]
MIAFNVMIAVFVLGYLGIVLEHNTKINKAAAALIMGGLLWAIYALFGTEILGLDYSSSWHHYLHSGGEKNGLVDFIVHHELVEHLYEISAILFFLLGAMGIVEIVDSFQGFRVITDQIKTRNIVKLIWVISILTFFMSAVLDNLTTTIVMVTLIRKILDNKENRWFFASMIVLSANAGGAFSPIGDVTTIMLWIGGQVTSTHIITSLFIPSLVSMLIPLFIASIVLKGKREEPQLEESETREYTTPGERKLIFFAGIICLLFVPVFKTVTHLPPFIGMLLGLGVMWFVSEVMIQKKPHDDQRKLSVIKTIHKLDTPTILFFLGVLLGVSALTSAGQLDMMAELMDKHIGDIYGINIAIGFLSSIVDNVPLVASAMGMYEVAGADAVGYLTNFVQDGQFWSFLAYCAGTGGSILIVGSAAGVAAMGMEGITFGWYFKKISWIAAIGYLAGAFTYMFCNGVF